MMYGIRELKDVIKPDNCPYCTRGRRTVRRSMPEADILEVMVWTEKCDSCNGTGVY